MSRYYDHWHDSAEPAWMIEPTTEWHPQFPGQRYAGDIGVEHAPAVRHQVGHRHAAPQHGDVGDQPPVAAPPDALAAHHRRGPGR
ncbi:hypothetical protein, partial [Micromonospora sp. AMSO12t]|uniref:hypothetical protein n=1 Tax=Micromonospora sp. AMSO12t TaxID=2650410 RepID=UPI001788A467